MKRLFIVFGVMAFAYAVTAAALADTIEVSQPVAMTNNSEYDRNPSIVKHGDAYWLFYTKGDDTSTSGVRGDGYDADADTYMIYYKTAGSLAGLETAGEILLDKTRPADFDQRVVSAVSFKGDLYAFASSGQSGTNRGLYYYKYATATSSWGDAVELIADGTARGGHVNVVGDSNYVYIVWERTGCYGDFYKWDGASLTGPVQIDAGLQHQPKITLLAGKLYAVTIDDASSNIAVFRSDDGGTNWSSDSVAIAGAGLYDPCIFNDGTDLYVVTAPWDSGNDQQYLMQAKCSAGTWSTAKMVTNGGYGGAYWWDYWPVGYCEGGDVYVFYTTETGSPTYSDGEIAMLKMDWNLANDHYCYIQNAIDAASSGDTVNVAAGTYTEWQSSSKASLVVGKSLHLVGSGDDCVIQGPRSSSDYGMSNADLVEVSASDVEIAGFKFSGAAATEEEQRAGTTFCIAADPATNLNVHDNTFTFYSQNSLQAQNGTNVLYQNNQHVRETRGVWYDPAGVEPGSYVDTARGGSGPSLWHCTGGTVSGNNIDTRGVGVFMYDCSNTTIGPNNSITGPGDPEDEAIHVQSCTNVTITGNTISGFTEGEAEYYPNGKKGAAVSVLGGTAIEITANAFSSCSKGVALAAASDGAEVHHNSSYSGCKWGVVIYSYGAEGGSAATNHEIHDENFEGVTRAGVEILAPGYYDWSTEELTFYGLKSRNANTWLITSTGNKIHRCSFPSGMGIDGSGGNLWDDDLDTGNTWSDFSANAGYPDHYDVPGGAGSVDRYPTGYVKGPYAEIYVDAVTGDDSNTGYDPAHAKQTIQAGIDAVAGSTVHVAPGTYAEEVTIGKADLTLQSDTKWGAIIRPPTTPANFGAAIYISANGVTVDGFEIDGTTVCKNGILGWETSGLTIKNNKVHGAVKAWDGCGILLFSWGNSGTVYDNLIKDNVVYDTGRMGIMVMDYGGGKYTVTSGNTISGNTVYDAWKKSTEWGDHGGGIQINVGKNCSITNNLIYDVQEDQRGIYMYGSAAGNSITSNTITNNSIGIQLWISGEGGSPPIDWGSDAATSPQVRYNNIYGNTSYAAISSNIQGTPMVMDAENNWWGSPNGPSDPSGSLEMPENSSATVAEMLNAAPAGRLGDVVSDNVDYYPWSDRKLHLYGLDRNSSQITLEKPASGPTLIVDGSHFQTAVPLNVKDPFQISLLGEVPGNDVWNFNHYHPDARFDDNNFGDCEYYRLVIDTDGGIEASFYTGGGTGEYLEWALYYTDSTGNIQTVLGGVVENPYLDENEDFHAFLRVYPDHTYRTFDGTGEDLDPVNYVEIWGGIGMPTDLAGYSIFQPGYLGSDWYADDDVEMDPQYGNVLSLDAQDLYLRPGETVVVNLDVSDLLQDIYGGQASMGYDAGMLSISVADLGDGEDDWEVLVELSTASGGEIDLTFGNWSGTADLDADATVATMTFTAGSTDGTTQVSFRADEDLEETILADTNANAVYPAKINSQTITVDGTAPINVTIAAVPSDWTNSTNVQLTFSASDVLAGIDKYELRVAQVDPVTDVEILEKLAWFEATSPKDIDVSAWADGTYKAYVKAYDKSGNTATASTHFYLDKTEPNEFTPTADPDWWTNAASISISFSTTDATSGVDHYELDVDGGGYSTVTSPHGVLTSGLSDGTHTVSVKAVDKALNKWVEQVTIYYDGTAPTDLSLSAPTAWTNAASVQVTFSANGEVSGNAKYELRFDSGSWTQMASSPYTLDVSTLSDGNHKLSLQVTDNAGNVATGTDLAQINLDKTDPTISIDSATQDAGATDLFAGNNALQGTVTIVVSAADQVGLSGLDGIPEVTLTFSDSTTSGPLSGAASGGDTFTYTYAVTSSTPNGTATINASVSDVAGNPAAAAPKTFTVNKNEISGSVELESLNPASGGITRTVVFKATDSSGVVLKAWDIGVAFASGSSVGTYVLTDVPQNTVALSAKTAWNLRRRINSLDMSLNDGQAAADFTGTSMLLGGDVNGSNTINILDWAWLRINWFQSGTDNRGDINGDGAVYTGDYMILVSNWFKKGDAE